MAEGRQGRGAAAKRDYAQQDRLLALAEPSDAAAAAAAWLRTDTALDRGAVEAHCATELLKQCLAMPDSSASFSVLFTSDQAIQGLSELTPTTALGLPDGAALKNREYSGDSDVAVHERTEVARFPVAKFDVQLHAQVRSGLLQRSKHVRARRVLPPHSCGRLAQRCCCLLPCRVRLSLLACVWWRHSSSATRSTRATWL